MTDGLYLLLLEDVINVSLTDIIEHDHQDYKNHYIFQQGGGLPIMIYITHHHF